MTSNQDITEVGPGNNTNKDVSPFEINAENGISISFTTCIASNFETLRRKIADANARIADIDNFKLAEFMCQGVDRWNAAIHEAILECEDGILQDFKELNESIGGQQAGQRVRQLAVHQAD